MSLRKFNPINTRPSSLLLLIVILCNLANTSAFFWRKNPSAALCTINLSKKPTSLLQRLGASTAKDRSCIVRGGAAGESDVDGDAERESPPRHYPKQKQTEEGLPVKDEMSVKDEDEEWHDAEEMEEDEGWTEEDGARLHQMEVEGWFDEKYDSAVVSEQDDEGNELDEGFPKMKEAGDQQVEIPLADVLADQQKEQSEAVQENDNGDEFMEAREDPFDGVSTVGTVNTDDDSSAFVDRMELADAYDEGLLEDELEEEGSPVLVMGEKEQDNYDNILQSDSRISAQDVSPGGGTDDDSDEVKTEEDSDKGGVDSNEEATEAAISVSPQSNEVEMPKEITDDMEQLLMKELHWKKYEVQAMRPDIAAVVVHKRLRRPQEGMPLQWYTDSNKVPSTTAKLSKVLKGVVPICLGAAAIYAGRDISLENCGKRLPKPSLLKAPAFLKKSAKAQTKASEDSVRHEVTITDTEPTSEDTNTDASGPSSSVNESSADAEDSQQSLSPEDNVDGDYRRQNLQSAKKDEDQSALDKLITKLEILIKGLFTKEL